MALQDTISYITNKSQLENMNGLRWASFIMMSFRVMLCILICQVSNLYNIIHYKQVSIGMPQDSFLIIILRLLQYYRFIWKLVLSLFFMQYHHLIIAKCHLYVIKVRNERLMTIFNQRFPRDRLQLLLYDSFLIIILTLFNVPHLYSFKFLIKKEQIVIHSCYPIFSLPCRFIHEKNDSLIIYILA